jgi:hypothetical protein
MAVLPTPRSAENKPSVGLPVRLSASSRVDLEGRY